MTGLGWVLATWLCHCACVSALAEDVLWVSDLDKDPKLIGREVVVEGRFQGRVGANLDQLRLRNLSPDRFEFRLDPKVDRKFPSNLQFIRLTGRLTSSGERLVMQVQSWSKVTSTDVDRYRDAASRIRPGDHRAWSELGERTQRLAELYDEDEIRALAVEAKGNGLRAREAALRNTESEELLRIADQAGHVGLSEGEARRMRHKALRWRLDSLAAGQATADQWSELARTIANLLPGAATPLKGPDEPALEKYHINPIEAYEKNPSARQAYDRELWVEATSQTLEVRSKVRDVDLTQLASDAKRLVPERPALSLGFLRRWAESEAARIQTLPPASQVRRLADVLRNDLNDADRAKQVLTEWLQARRLKLSAKDADGRVRLARDYRADVGDQEMALRLLLEAIEIEADLPAAVQELKDLGYVRGPSGWVKGGAAESAAVAAARARAPQLNMTPAQVREILGEPRPEGKLRFSDRRDGRPVVLEQWTFHGPKDLYITFLVVSSSEARVIAINTHSQK